MATRLVRAGVQVERDHQKTGVLGRHNEVAAIRVRHVAVEELGRNVVVDRDAVGSDRNTIHRRNRSLDDDLLAVVRSVREIRDRVVAVPVIAVSLTNHTGRRVRTNTREVITRIVRCRRRGVRRRAQTNVQRLNRPLQVVEQNFVVSLVDEDALFTVDTDQREADALDEDVVNLRVDEDVVDQQLQLNVRGRELIGRMDRAVRSLRTRKLRSRRNRAHELSRRGEIDGDEALAVRDRDRRNRQTRVEVEPEQQRNPEFHRLLRRLGRLRARAKRLDFTNTSIGAAVGLNVLLLADVALPASTLAGGNVELVVEVVDVRRVLVKRVAVDSHRDLLDETVTEEVGVANVVLLIGSDTAEGLNSRCRHGHVERHVVEEIAELRNAELHLAAELAVARLGANLVVFVADRSERLEVRVHEQNVRLLNVHQGRRRVSDRRIIGSGASDVAQTAIQQVSRHQHSVLLPVICDSLVPHTSQLIF